ncbi:Mpo1-like protein [Gilvimarinus sp. F26214L]|uniref:Mpo1-like protein n=1 Tax=Gilvimarinus sp. DZF01 TaxID=3461371 RepID=UPI00404666BB
MSNTDARYQSFEEFWPFYLREHSKPATRRLHFIGTLLLFPVVVLGVVQSAYWLLLLPVVGYGFAWVAHGLIERNRPATFTYPLWSLLADFKMFFAMCRGSLSEELERHVPRGGR